MRWGRERRAAHFEGASPPSPLLQGGATGIEDQATAKLLARLAVPIDDDLTIVRNWRRLMSRPARHPARWASALAAAATVFVLALALGLWRGRSPSPSAIDVVASSGGVFFTGRTEAGRPGATGQTLHEGQRIRTDEWGQALLRADGVAAVLVEPSSDVTLERLTGGYFLRLGSGGVVAHVSKRPPGAPFVVLTDRYTVKVVGTLFSVRQGPGDRVEVSVREGTVVVSEGATEIARVRAGSRWRSDAAECEADQTSDGTAHLLKATLASGVAMADVQLELELELVSAGRTAGSLPALMGAAVAHSASSEPGVPRPASASGAPRHHTLFAPAPTVEAPPLDLGPIAVPHPAPPFAGPVAPATDYGRALSLQAAGDYRGAADALALAADLDPQRAELALYGLGRLKLRHLADPEGALAAFRSYRDRYAMGALLPDVDLSIFEIEASLGRHKQALAEGAHYLATHPASGKSDEVHLLRAHLMRETGNCDGALREYALVSSLADEATYAIAYCQRQLGDRAAATRTLRQYLARFPTGAHSAEARGALDDARSGL